MTVANPLNSLIPDRSKDTQKVYNNPTPHNKSPKKRRVADTSIECYHQISASGQIQKEKDLILSLITRHQPVTSRALIALSGKERGNITRSLWNLAESGSIKIAFTAKCPITNKRVRHYCLSSWEGGNGGQ